MVAPSSMSEKWKKAVSATLMAMIAASVTLPLPAQQKAAMPTVVAEEETAETPKKPGHEGIKVHGHWVMDLKDKDGKVIDHRDFQNALVSGGTAGSDLLSLLLLGWLVPSNLQINAQSVLPPPRTSPTPAQNNTTYSLYPASSQSAGCHFNIDEFNNTFYCAPGMTERAGYTLTNGQKTDTQVILQGQFVAVAPITVRYVGTQMLTCSEGPVPSGPPTLAPSACPTQDTNFNNGEYFINTHDFTGTALQSPIAVATGQTLAITVTLSFT
jgi:hypothetical protein